MLYILLFARFIAYNQIIRFSRFFHRIRKNALFEGPFKFCPRLLYNRMINRCSYPSVTLHTSHRVESVNFHFNRICLHGSVAFISLNLNSFNLLVFEWIIIELYPDSQYINLLHRPKLSHNWLM